MQGRHPLRSVLALGVCLALIALACAASSPREEVMQTQQKERPSSLGDLLKMRREEKSRAVPATPEEKLITKLRKAAAHHTWSSPRLRQRPASWAHATVKAAKKPSVGAVTLPTLAEVRERRDNPQPQLTNRTHAFPETDSVSLEVYWAGSDNAQVMLVLVVAESEAETATHNLYVSKDEGATYLPAAGISKLISRVHISQNIIFAVPIDPDLKTVYTANVTATSVIFTAVFTPIGFTDVNVHPVDANLWLGVVNTGDYFSTVNVTLDGGQTFHSIANYVLYADWSERHNERAIMVTTSYQGTLEDLHFQLIDVLEKPFERYYLLGCYDFVQTGLFTYAVELPTGDFEREKLHVSLNGGRSFSAVSFPIQGYETDTAVLSIGSIAAAAVLHTSTIKIADQFIELVSSKTNLSATKADFTPSVPAEGLGPLPLAFPPSKNQDGCQIMPSMKGRIVVVGRGNCLFYDKIINAEDAGAAAVIIVNNEDKDIVPTTNANELPGIPAYTVQYTVGQQLKSGDMVRLLEVNQQEIEAQSETNLFVSAGAGDNFWLSLLGVLYKEAKYTDEGYEAETLDTYLPAGLNGTLLANMVAEDGNVVTAVSFDSGNTWRSLDAPKGVSCSTPPCKLHIGLQASHEVNGLPLPQSAPEAAQLIIANGYVGEGLGAEQEDADVYVSMSGGCSWQKTTLEGPHDFRILDSGAVIVAVPSQNATDSIMYSLDYGTTFTPYRFSANGPVALRGLVADPATTSLIAYLYYGDSDNQQVKGVVLDFSSVLTPCTANMYTTISLGSDCSGRDCINGEHFDYEIRRPNTACSNGRDYDQYANAVSCPCTIEDFQCIPGFIRYDSVDNDTSSCVPDATIPLKCEGTATTKKVLPYTLTWGDNCVNDFGVSTQFYDYVTFPCVRTRTSDPTRVVVEKKASWSTAWLVALLLILAAAIVFFFGLYFSKSLRDRTLKEFGWDGYFAKMLVRFGCLKPSRNFRYNNMELDADADLRNDDDDDDELLFGEDARPV